MEIVLYRGAEKLIVELQVDPETGEIGTDVPLDLLVQRNPIGTAAYVLNTRADIAKVKKHIDNMQQMYDAMLKTLKRTEEALKQAMQMTGTLSISADDKTFKAVLLKERDERVEIFDEKQVPANYFREIPARYEPNKILISVAIKAGTNVPGARLVKNDRLEIG